MRIEWGIKLYIWVVHINLELIVDRIDKKWMHKKTNWKWYESTFKTIEHIGEWSQDRTHWGSQLICRAHKLAFCTDGWVWKCLERMQFGMETLKYHKSCCIATAQK